MKRPVRIASLAAALWMSTFATADVVTVGEGQSIQEAIDAAKNGTTIMVDAGSYAESIDFMGKAITVIATDGASATTIDAGGAGAVVRFMSGEQGDSRLDGFTLTGGTGDVDVYGHPVGGGVVTGAGTRPTVERCVFLLNTADFGGGMFNDGAPRVANCVFLANGATFGGAVFNNNSNPRFVNCTMTTNSASFGGGFYNVGSTPRIANSILWDNGAPEIQGSDAIVRFSVVQGGWDGPGESNIDLDPEFVDGADGRLKPDSPAIDAADAGAYTGGPFDLDGNDRIIDDPEREDTGAGKPPYLDMGAFEFLPVVCRGDFDGDGLVGFTDLIQLLAAFGPCGGRPGECVEDLNFDGIVDFNDLLSLLVAWGPVCS